jgi:hypothetical protein
MLIKDLSKNKFNNLMGQKATDSKNVKMDKHKEIHYSERK